MPTVSVIIPVFNDAAYLAEALDSVFGQTRPVDEVIVIDDGSTDGSDQVAEGYLPRIRLFRQENQGISSARNAGLNAASGEMIAFLDADDLWTRDSVAVRLDRLEAGAGLDIVYGAAEQFLSPELDEATRARLHCPEGRTAVRYAGSMIIRKSLFDRVGSFDTGLRVGETIDWVLRAGDAGATMAAVDDLVMRRRIHGANTMVAERPSQSDYLKALRASLARKSAASAQS